MEQARYWMWSKRKHSLSSHFQASTNPLSGDSWEEQAFAQDASGPLGGCVWPPRSYSCSFCRREFRSAQALGGHMNVHRRDRARLKQSSSHHNDHQVLHHFQQNHHSPILNPSTPVDVQYPSQICTMVYKPNPDTDRVVFASPTTRVSPPTKQENHKEKTFVPIFSSPIIDHERSMKSSIYAPPSSWSNLVADRYFQVSDLNDEERNSKFIGSNSRAKDDYVTADLSVSLNLVVRRSLPTSPVGKEEALISCKRQRTDDSSIPLQSFRKSSSSSDDRQPEEARLKLSSSSSSIEEIDLELRLGDLPKVK